MSTKRTSKPVRRRAQIRDVDDAAAVRTLADLTTQIRAREAERAAEQDRRRTDGRRQRDAKINELVHRVLSLATPPLPAKEERPASPALVAERKQRAVVECQILRRQSGVPGRYADVDLARCPRVLPEKYHGMAGVLLGVIDRPCLIAIGGEPGTGKTALACGLVNAYCGRGRSARYARAQKFLNELGDAPFGTGAKQRIRERYAAADLLVLDEIQSTQDGQVWLDELEYLIDERYGRFKGEGDDRRTFATVLIGNLTAEALQDRLGRRVWRRLDEGGGFFEATWEPVYPILLAAGLAS